MASLPKTYKALVFNKANDEVKLTDVELQHPAEGQVLIKVLACGVCYSDLAVHAGYLGNVYPRIPGHEIVGDIVEVGPGVTTAKVGDRVGSMWHGGHDGTCRACRRGMNQICDNKAINGVSRDGGMAEYAILRSEALASLPTDVEPAIVAPLLCAGMAVFNGLRNLKYPQGSLVAVQGLGALGHLGLQFAKKSGYEVVAVSSGSSKAELAKQLGADHYIDTSATDVKEELLKLGGADVIINTAPNAGVITSLAAGLARGGTLLILSSSGLVQFDTMTMMAKAQKIQGWSSGHAVDAEDTVKFAKVHNITPMVQQYPFADVEKALNDARAGKTRFKNVLVM